MPLIESANKSAYSKNFHELVASGYSEKRAHEIAKAVAWRAKHEKKKKKKKH